MIKIKNKYYKKLTLEKSYILGVIGPGDGFMEYKPNNSQYRVTLEATDLNFVKYFASCLKKVYGIKPKIKKIPIRNFGVKNTFMVRLGSKQICEDLLNYNIPFKEKLWRIPKIIKNSPKGIKAKYIQGFADSQGSVRINKKRIILCNQNKTGLIETEKLLHELGIQSVCYEKNGIFICNLRDIILFSNLINFNISYKKNRLRDIINNCKVWRVTPKEISKLKPQIVKSRRKGFSYPKIAKKLNTSITSSWRYPKHINVGLLK